MTDDIFDNVKKDNNYLYERQKSMLKTFMEHGAISETQYRDTLSKLAAKMHMDDAGDNKKETS